MGDSARPDWAGRLRKVWRQVGQKDTAALVVSAPANITYLTGFDGSQSLLVVGPSTGWLLLDDVVSLYDSGLNYKSCD